MTMNKQKDDDNTQREGGCSPPACSVPWGEDGCDWTGEDITDDALCELRYEVAEMLEYAGFAAHHLRKAMYRFQDPEEDKMVALKSAQIQAETAAKAFREVERMAKVMADTCNDWSKL